MENYNLEVERIIKEIKAQKAKKVAIQLPDGLKPKAIELTREIESKTNAKILIWSGSNFGGCDLPIVQLEKLKVDLLIHFGHAPFRK